MDDPPYISRPARKVRQTRHLSLRDIYRRGGCVPYPVAEHLRGFGDAGREEGGRKKKKKEGDEGVLIAGWFG